MAAYPAQRLQTNAAWSAQFTFTGVNITGWVMTGRAQSTKNAGKFVDLSIANGQIVVNNAATGTFTVALTQAEAAALGDGTTIFEVLRESPAPRRPVLRFTIQCYKGVAT